MDSITISIERLSAAEFSVILRPRGVDATEASVKIPANQFLAGGALDVQKNQKFFLETQGDSEEFRTLGRLLFEAIHVGDVAAAWDSAASRAKNARDDWRRLSAEKKRDTAEPDGLQVYLRVHEDLAALPWELLRDKSHLMLDGFITVMRASTRAFKTWEDSRIWPIRLMVVVGAGADEVDDLGAINELEAIREVLREGEHLFDVRVFESRKLDTFRPVELKRELEKFQPHIFHFIGHGRTDDDNPRLLLTDKRHQHEWTSVDIADHVGNLKSVLRLAVVNACRSAEPGQSDSFSVAQAFLDGGALSVLSMQSDVRGQAAVSWSRNLYLSLLKGDPLDKAVAAARRDVSTELGATTRNAFVPVLMLNGATPEEVITCPKRLPMSPQELDRVRREFVDRHDHRSDVIHSMVKSEIATQQCSAVAVWGRDEKIGKTWFQLWVLQAFAHQNYSIYAVDGFNKGDWLQYILAICKGFTGNDTFRQPLPLETRTRFYDDLARIAGIAPPASGAHPDVTLASLANRNDGHEKVLAAFHHALRKQAETKPVILAFGAFVNGPQSLSPAHVRTLKEYLWDRIAQESSGKVKVLVELPFDTSSDYKLDFPEDFWKSIELQPFAAGEAGEWLKEFFLRRNPGRSLPSIADGLTKLNKPVRPDQLPKLVTLLEALSD
jgi:hypothetical protein